MNRALLRLSLACLVMFVLLLININYVQAFESNSLASEPQQQPDLQPAVPVPARRDHRHRRRRPDVMIAKSKLVKGTAASTSASTRTAPMYAPVTGYDSIVRRRPASRRPRTST